MPSKLTYKYVKEYIEKNGDTLISKEYVNNRKLLEIKCHICDKKYRQRFGSITKGFYHNKNYCVNNISKFERKKIKNDDPNKKVCYGFTHREGKLLDNDCFYDAKDKKDSLSSWCKKCFRANDKAKGKNRCKTKDKVCLECKKEYKARPKQKFCSKKCADISYTGSEKAKQNGHKGGLKSVKSQNRRSKGEIHFAKLCIEAYGEEFVKTNVQMFGGFDCDVILTKSFKVIENGEEKKYRGIGICYDGIFHRKEIFKNQSLKQIQTRDKIRKKNVEKAGFLHYVIEDNGKYDSAFVETEFAIMKMKLLEI